MEIFLGFCVLVLISFSFQLFIENSSLKKENKNLKNCCEELGNVSVYSSKWNGEAGMEDWFKEHQLEIIKIFEKHNLDWSNVKELRL